MRSLASFSRLVNWRWMPAVGLVIGSLLFVLLAVVLIPDELVLSSTEQTDASRQARGQALARFGATMPNKPRMDDDASLFGTKASESEPPRAVGRDAVQSIFHPVAPTELPVAPPDPDPPPPPPEPPPAPPPTATIFTLENPPPPPPNPAALEPPPAPTPAPAAPAEAPAPPPEAEAAPAEAPAATEEAPPGAPAPP